MLGLIIFLIVTIIFLLVQLISYRRQVGEICRHIEFVKKNNTNKILFGDYDYKELKRLEDEINELSEKVGVANVNLSKLKTGKVSAVRFSTLEAICDVLDCQPGDILEFKREEK